MVQEANPRNRALMTKFGSVAQQKAPSRAGNAGSAYVHSPFGIAFLDSHGTFFKANLAWNGVIAQ